MKFHPMAEIFPLMQDDELEGLVQDIKARGQQNPVVVLDNMVLDGRNRFRACKKLGIEPKTINFKNGISPFHFVVSQNLHRRHLTAGQRAIIIDDICTREQEKFGKRDKLKKRELYGRGDLAVIFGKPMGISKAAVGQARRIKGADPKVFAELKAGKITLREGMKMTKQYFNTSGGEVSEFLKKIRAMGEDGYFWTACYDPNEKSFKSLFFKDPTLKVGPVWNGCKSFIHLSDSVGAMAGEVLASQPKVKVAA